MKFGDTRFLPDSMYKNTHVQHVHTQMQRKPNSYYCTLQPCIVSTVCYQSCVDILKECHQHCCLYVLTSARCLLLLSKCNVSPTAVQHLIFECKKQERPFSGQPYWHYELRNVTSFTPQCTNDIINHLGPTLILHMKRILLGCHIRHLAGNCSKSRLVSLFTLDLIIIIV